MTPEAIPPTTCVRLRRPTSELNELAITATTTRLPNSTERWLSGTSKSSPTPPNVPTTRPKSRYASPDIFIACRSLTAIVSAIGKVSRSTVAGRTSGRISVNAGTTTRAKPKTHRTLHHGPQPHRDEQDEKLHLHHRFSKTRPTRTRSTRPHPWRIPCPIIQATFARFSKPGRRRLSGPACRR